MWLQCKMKGITERKSKFPQHRAIRKGHILGLLTEKISADTGEHPLEERL